MTRHFARAVFAAALIAPLLGGGAAAQTMILATDAAGTSYNAMGSAAAKVLTEQSPYRIIVRPFGGPDAYSDALNNGEIDLAMQSSSSADLAYRGDTRSGEPQTDLRLLRSGIGGIYVSFIVRESSGIKTLADLKGKRITSDFGGHAVISKSMTGALKSAGLTWDDVTAVPVTGANEGVEALASGRVDASWASLGQPVARELNAKEPIRYLGFEDTPETVATLREEIFPGVNLREVKQNAELGVPGDVKLINYDAYLITHAGLDDERVRALAGALWDASKELTTAHRGLAGFTNENAVTTNPMIPYHPAAIEVYKEKGAWTDEAAKAQEAKLSAAKSAAAK